MEEELLPPRMFAAGDEPLGERVNSYHKLKMTEMLIDTLEPEELDFLRKSTFGKVLAIEENPPFSGAFGQHVVVRLLKVNKKYEVWIQFAGNPVRMSLREFAIVTGLNCRKIPEPTKRKKNPLKVKLYWNELFGSLKFGTVDIAIDMLKKKVVKGTQARIKFACLAITSSILFPSSHTPHIMPDHVEMIRDLDEFLAFPWGRASFHTLVTSLISKDEIALSQSSVAIRGYVDAIQMVLLAAIPQLKEEITQSEPIVIEDSESDDESTEEHAPPEEEKAVHSEKPSQTTKYCLIPGHAKSIDTDCQVRVKCILDEPYEEWSAGLDFLWLDEYDDPAVENMVCLINEGFAFRKEMFKGGVSATDLAHKDHHSEAPDCDGSDSQTHILIANLVASQLGEKIRSPPTDIRVEISSLEKRIYEALDAKLEKIVASNIQSQQLAFIQNTISQSLQGIDKKVADTLACQLKTMEASLLKGLSQAIGQPCSSHDVPAGETVYEKSYQPPQLSENVVPHVNPSIPAELDNITHAEAADFRISAVLRDLNTVPDLSTQETTDVNARSQPLEGELPDEEDNQGAEPDTVIPSKAVYSELPAQKSVHETGDITLPEESEVATYMNADQSEEPVEPNQNSEKEFDHSLDAQPIDVDEPVAQEVEIEETHIPFYLLEMPSFSLGLSQEGAVVGEEMHNTSTDASPPRGQELDVLEQRKSKRPRSRPAGLQDYKCDPKVSSGLCIIPDLEHRFKRFVNTTHISLTAIVYFPGVVDALVGFLSRALASVSTVAIYDTTLPVALMNQTTHFHKTAVKDRAKLKFTTVPLPKPLVKSPDRIYFPFNLDKQHWVGVCIDMKAWTLFVLDCNTSFRSDSFLKKELNPIATLIPYVLKYVGYMETIPSGKAFTVSRCKGIPQITSQSDAGVMAVLLIEAHAAEGLGGCKSITPRLLPEASKQLAVRLFESIYM
ncbi:hypothetical protein IGI04_007451 [Brassica rapa subsp. trilocularis]|uniref:Ubiquitin-like protease family profile domain-containing protein n=1 Tax=Brassica rapa subsp. trilocularis TaxID=1813537 RepID=A0ABQ7NJR6_BRACM|nr:hypothetical protein IGI04_007451 [Brassica rapa subsp. trilocularis]